MLRRVVVTFVALVIIVVPGTAASTSNLSPAQLLNLSRAPAESYTATIRIWNPLAGDAEVHVSWSGGVGVFAAQRDGRVSQMIVDSSGVCVSQPDSPMAKSFQPLPDDIDLLLENYSAATAQGPSIAGRDTIELRIVGKSGGRSTRTLWLDRHTGVVLKRTDMNYRGDILERWEVTHIVYSPSIDEATLRAVQQAMKARRASGAGPTPAPREVVNSSGVAAVLPKWLPVGYRLAGSGLVMSGQVVQAIYSDGLSPISLYVRRVPWFARKPSRPTLVEFDTGQAIEWEGKGFRFVLVGDIDPNILLNIAVSVL